MFACAGVHGRVKGARGCTLSLAFLRGKTVDTRCVRVDGTRIKADTWYRLNKQHRFVVEK